MSKKPGLFLHGRLLGQTVSKTKTINPTPAPKLTPGRVKMTEGRPGGLKRGGKSRQYSLFHILSKKIHQNKTICNKVQDLLDIQ